MRMDQDYVVTCFSSAHAEAVSGLIRSTLPEALASSSDGELSSWDERFTKEGILRRMNDRLAYVAVYRNRIVGVILLAPVGEGREVEALAVAPDHRDAGVGAMLVQTAERRAAELGVRMLAVSDLLKDNGFFRRMGYVRTEEVLPLQKALA